MAKKKHRDQGSGIGDQKVEKKITGSGADVASHEDEQGKVKCKCIVPCVWRGYRDEGDTVWIEKELIEKDAFIRMHFKAVPLPEGQRRQDGEEGSGDGETAANDGETGSGEGGTAAGGEGGTAAGGEGGTAAGDGENAAGDGENAAGENGQGELGLK